jgi:hypothetical protein
MWEQNDAKTDLTQNDRVDSELGLIVPSQSITRWSGAGFVASERTFAAY